MLLKDFVMPTASAFDIERPRNRFVGLEKGFVYMHYSNHFSWSDSAVGTLLLCKHEWIHQQFDSE